MFNVVQRGSRNKVTGMMTTWEAHPRSGPVELVWGLLHSPRDSAVGRSGVGCSHRRKTSSRNRVVIPLFGHETTAGFCRATSDIFDMLHRRRYERRRDGRITGEARSRNGIDRLWRSRRQFFRLGLDLQLRTMKIWGSHVRRRSCRCQSPV